MVDGTGIIPDVWNEKLPLRQLLYKADSFLQARGPKDGKKREKKYRRKPLHNEKHKDTDIQGNGIKKPPHDGTPQVTQQQPDLEVQN